jgi:hypothetical protein
MYNSVCNIIEMLLLVPENKHRCHSHARTGLCFLSAFCSSVRTELGSRASLCAKFQYLKIRADGTTVG